jgi:mycothiol synthase
VRVQAYTADDSDRVVAFLNACAAGDASLQPITARAWSDYVAQSYNRGGRDFALATSDGETVGLVVSYGVGELRHFRIHVLPDARRQGIGTRLLRVVEGQDGGLQQCNCLVSWPAGIAFLEHHGFASAARSCDMVRDAPAPAPVAPPPGVRLRPYEGRDDAAWTALTDEGYVGTPGYTPLTPADLARFRADPSSHLWIAEEGGRVVGLCHTFLWNGERPFVNSVVVACAARGRGLGRALTVAGLRTLADSGHTRVELNVRADNAPAVRIYERLGFTTVEEVVTYRRRRAAADQPGKE